MLYVSSGHAANDPGAVANGTTEYIEVNKIAKQIVDSIKTQYPTTFIDDTLINTIKFLGAKMLSNDISFELHLDTAMSESATGCTLYYDATKPEYKLFGDAFLNNYCEITNIPSRGVMPDTSNRHGQLGFTRTGKSYLLEMGFISNPNELDYLRKNGANSFLYSFMRAIGKYPEAIPAWAIDAWKWAQDNKLISDGTKFSDPLSKGELIVFLKRFSDSLKTN